MIGFRDKSIHFEFPEPLPLKMTLSDIFKGECNKQIGYTLRVGGKGSGLGDRRNWDSYLVNGQHHRITVDEARELMGFPGDFVFPVSKAQAMKQLGNSVAVDAIRATASELIKALSLHPKRTQARDEASLYATRLITA